MKCPDAVRLLPADAHTKIDPVAARRSISSGRIPIFMPGGRFLRPGVYDPFGGTATEGEPWRPNSHRTARLVACTETAKQVETAARGIDARAPWVERRPLAMLATPLVSLCDHTKALNDSLGTETVERSVWPAADRALLVDASRRLKKHCKGPLRVLRHTLTGHMDLAVLQPGAQPVSSLPELLLPPLGDVLVVLVLCFNYRRVYTWVRRPEDAAPDEVEIMTEYPLAIRAKVSDGSISEIASQSFVAEDPLGPLMRGLVRVIKVYNFLAATAQPRRPPITLTPQENL